MALKKQLSALLLAMALMASMSACGGKPAESAASGNSGETANSAATGASADPSAGLSGGETQGTSAAPDASGNTPGDVNTPGSKNNQPGTTRKPDNKPNTTAKPTGATKATSGNSTPGGVKVDVTIKKGTKGLEEGVNFGGKTFKYAIGLALTDDMKRQISAFQLKYNCKIQTELLGFQEYVQQVITKKAGGVYYDILQLEGFRFPAAPIANICDPVENLITTADWYTASKKAKGGFDEELSRSFLWNNHLYAVVGSAGEFSPQMEVMYYNKKLLQEAGADDPRKLYESGKWNWDAYQKIGERVVKYSKSTYLCHGITLGRIRSWNDAFMVDISNPAKPTANLTSANIVNACKYMQTLATGNNAVVNYDLPGTDNTPALFLKGQVATYVGFHFDLYQNNNIGAGVEASNAFGKSLKNLGMVPVPLGPDNTRKANPVGSWLYGIGVGAGSSDPRAAMVFAKFSTTYKSNVKPKYTWSDADQKVIDGLAAGPKCWSNYAYSDGSNSGLDLMSEMVWKVSHGEDVAQTTASYNALLQHCIDVMISQQ